MGSSVHLPPDLLHTITRVGVKPEDRFAWLLEVTEKNLTDASAAELDELRWQMLAFAISARSDLAPEDRGGPLWGRAYVPVVRRLHEHLRAGLQGLRHQQQFTLPEPIIDQVVWRPTVGDIVPVNKRGVEQSFWAAVVGLLMRIGPRLRICKKATCARLFLSTNAKHKYCRPGCSQQVRTQKFRESHPEKVLEWKHEAYSRKRKRQLGPNAKVTRRPRSKPSGETKDAHKDRSG